MKRVRVFTAGDITFRAFSRYFYIDFGWHRYSDFALFKLQLLETIGEMLVVFGIQIVYFEFSFGFEL